MNVRPISAQGLTALAQVGRVTGDDVTVDGGTVCRRLAGTPSPGVDIALRAARNFGHPECVGVPLREEAATLESVGLATTEARAARMIGVEAAIPAVEDQGGVHRRAGGEPIDVVDGAAAPQAYAQRLVAQAVAEVSVLVADRQGRLDVPAPYGSMVRYRAVHRRAVLSRPGEQGRLAVALTGGRQLRVVDRPAFNALIVDRTVALVPVGGPADPGSGPALIVVHPGGLLDAVLAVFERSWTLGAPLIADGPAAVREDPSASTPTGDDLHLLHLLVEGLTDDAIAGKLDVSTRTVQRRVRDLIDLSGVRSRLQLVWEATRRGWI